MTIHMEKISLKDKYLSELSWIILDPMLFETVKLDLFYKQVLQKLVIEKLPKEEAAVFLDVNLRRLDEFEIAALAELKSNVTLSVLVANRIDTSDLYPKPVQPSQETRLADLPSISPAVLRILSRNGINTLADLLCRSRTEMLRIEGFGRTKLMRLSSTLSELGFKPDWDPKPVVKTVEKEQRRERKTFDTRKAQISLKTPLNKLKNMETRVLNTLRSNDILTVEDLLEYDRIALLKFRNMGSKTLADLSKRFAELGIETDWGELPE